MASFCWSFEGSLETIWSMSTECWKLDGLWPICRNVETIRTMPELYWTTSESWSSCCKVVWPMPSRRLLQPSRTIAQRASDYTVQPFPWSTFIIFLTKVFISFIKSFCSCHPYKFSFKYISMDFFLWLNAIPNKKIYFTYKLFKEISWENWKFSGWDMN